MDTKRSDSSRIERIERELRIWRVVGVFFACSMLIVICVAAMQDDEAPKVIRAREFQLIRDNGDVAGKFEVVGSGAFLRLYESNGFSSASITANDQRAGLYLENDERNNSAYIEAYLGGGSVGLSRKTDKGRYSAELVGGKDGTELRIERPDGTKDVVTGTKEPNSNR